MNRKATIFISGVGLSLVLSLFWFITFPDPMVKRMFTFPDTAGGSIHYETRFLPRTRDRRESINTLLEELVLGPVNIGAVPFIPEETRILAVMIDKDRNLYIDLSGEVLFSGEGETALDDVVFYLEKNIRYNFRFVRDVVVTVNGQVPGFPPIIEH